MGIKELQRRLKELMVENETQADFARRAGVAQSTISRIFSGQIPKLSVINRMAQSLAVPTPYFLEAIGSSSEVNVPYEETAERYDIPKEIYESVPKILAPVLSIASCGPLIESHDLDFPPGAANEYLPVSSTDENCFFIIASGDSMKPTVLQGDRLLVEPSTELSNNSLVVAVINREATVKRYRRISKGVMLVPDNHDYEPVFLPEETLEGVRIYRITLIMRKI